MIGPTVCTALNGKIALKHPELGVLVREDGAVCLPVRRSRVPRWTYGSKYRNGYFYVEVKGKSLLVHRIVAEAFLPNPEGKPCVDHINRNPTDNSVGNLRWCSYSENNMNTARNDRCKEKYGVNSKDDPAEYNRRQLRAWRKDNKAKVSEQNRRKHVVNMADGHRHRLPYDIAEQMLALPVSKRVFPIKEAQ